jgi:hypothetical protein
MRSPDGPATEIPKPPSSEQASVLTSPHSDHHLDGTSTLFAQSRRRSVVCAVLLALTAAVQVFTAALAHEDLAQKRSGPCSTARPFAKFTAEASRRFDLSEQIIRTVMGVESDCDPRALSSKGAIGLMQIMPATWQELRRRYALGNDPYDAHDNILAGSAYLREMRDRFGTPGFLAAYNAGPERYATYLATGRALPDETALYLAKVGASASANVPERTLKRVTPVAEIASSHLFAAHLSSSPAAEPAPINTQDDRSSVTEHPLWDMHRDGLFVPRSTTAVGQ